MTKKILIIDDDLKLRENLSELLSLSGYQSITAAEGKSGIELALKEKPSLILCDVSMPMLDGYGVLHILSRHPDTVCIPFIFLTGRNEIRDLRKGMGMGADDYLIKPFTESDLLDTIEIRLKKAERNHGDNFTNGKGIFQNAIETAAVSFEDDSSEINKYNKKHILYSPNQTPKHVYQVVTGKLKEYLINEEGKELITNIYTKGDFIGYTEILENIKYTHTVQAIEVSELMLIPKSDFLHLINTHQSVANEFFSLLCQSLRDKDDQLLSLAYNSLRKKVANGIVQVIDKFNDKRAGKPSIEISREDLAHIIGSAPESMIRVLKEFKEEKLIDVSDGSIIVLNEGKLRNLLY